MILNSFYSKNLYNEASLSASGAARTHLRTEPHAAQAAEQQPALALLTKLSSELAAEKQETERLRERLKSSLYEKNEVFALLKRCQQERDRVSGELREQKHGRDRELRRCCAQLEHVSKEYQQVMSERDTVHKEIEALLEKLAKTEAQLRAASGGGVASSSTVTSARYSMAFSDHHHQHHNQQQHMNDRLSETLDELEIDSLKNQLRLVTRQKDDALVRIEELQLRLKSFPELCFKEIPATPIPPTHSQADAAVVTGTAAGNQTWVSKPFFDSNLPS